MYWKEKFKSFSFYFRPCEHTTSRYTSSSYKQKHCYIGFIFILISPKFQEEIYCLITIPQKSYKKKIATLIIPIIEDKEELYTEIDYSERNAIDTHHALILTL